uniref:Uncharacterized protein n=1 Tax=Lactuca sativa TaxID=4236 RepID=A0A9R1UE15_LACSA|nr:hypothetical protein LSAT_V11C900462120 [Lactuca sativa]
MAKVHFTPPPALAQPVPTPDPEAIPNEKWVAGEDPILEVLNCVYPTLDSEDKRKDVIEYMQKLFRTSLGVEVYFISIKLLKFCMRRGLLISRVSSWSGSDSDMGVGLCQLFSKIILILF